MASAAAPPARRRSWFWLQGVICGAIAVAAPGTAAMTAILLAPGLAMFAIEQDRGRPLARAMLLMGAAASIMPLRSLWEQGGSLDAALTILGDPARPLLSWGASGIGWIAGQIAELATRVIFNAKATQQRRVLEEEREILTTEWIGRDP